ncbi:YbdD/YjiX family protein [Heyndrickxia acidicola]|uniref:YbdD/YjiX family protein n=1 Tax=Heyndrickxia acidicola TaxID=209389 RepID=A0ABU6MEQ2_9BACI|nr:YbdD/YjiX family protein [Heyndrickxia acidicola]MED1203134.1 YbdD/YjiX family protein [Heyndrickxia acidicola]
MSFMNRLRRMRSHIKTIIGMPNYERYLFHQQQFHPNDPVMTEKEYYLFILKDRYESGKVNRCC